MKVIEIMSLFAEMKGDFQVERSIVDGVETLNTRMIAQDAFLSKGRSLQHLLQDYTYYPYFYPLHTHTSVKWVPASNRSRQGGWPKAYSDVNAVLDLAHLADLEMINRLKKCACGKWLFAKFPHQQFCSAHCRETAFRSSPEQKELRRKRARDYYRLHRSGKVK